VVSTLSFYIIHVVVVVVFTNYLLLICSLVHHPSLLRLLLLTQITFDTLQLSKNNYAKKQSTTIPKFDKLITTFYLMKIIEHDTKLIKQKNSFNDHFSSLSILCYLKY
jgi:hypothetical protein